MEQLQYLQNCRVSPQSPLSSATKYTLLCRNKRKDPKERARQVLFFQWEWKTAVFILQAKPSVPKEDEKINLFLFGLSVRIPGCRHRQPTCKKRLPHVSCLCKLILISAYCITEFQHQAGTLALRSIISKYFVQHSFNFHLVNFSHKLINKPIPSEIRIIKLLTSLSSCHLTHFASCTFPYAFSLTCCPLGPCDPGKPVSPFGPRGP